MGQRASASADRGQPAGNAAGASRDSGGAAPHIRCYTCSGVFMATQQADHIRCPYCSTINGVSRTAVQAARSAPAARATAQGQQAQIPATAAQRQEQLLRRLQTREITPLELLILREFVEHLQQTRAGASALEIDAHTASWTVDDVSKLPEELRQCCVCLDDVEVGQQVRTLPCLHTFHAACAEEWLGKKKVCPLCQFSIDSNGEGDGADEAAAAAGGGGSTAA